MSICGPLFIFEASTRCPRSVWSQPNYYPKVLVDCMFHYILKNEYT